LIIGAFSINVLNNLVGEQVCSLKNGDNKMKISWRLLLTVSIGCSTLAHAQVPSRVEITPDIGIAPQVVIPGAGDYDLYEVGTAAELQFRDWPNNPWGYALAIGYGIWTTDKDASRPGLNLYDYSGELEIVPFGVSALYRAYSDESLSVILDAGVRYIITDSKIKARYALDDSNQKYPVDIDDSILARFAIGTDYQVDSDMIWSLLLGYYYDIEKGDVTTQFGKARGNIMESFFIEAALRFPL